MIRFSHTLQNPEVLRKSGNNSPIGKCKDKSGQVERGSISMREKETMGRGNLGKRNRKGKGGDKEKGGCQRKVVR